jgi:hypothetical protein
MYILHFFLHLYLKNHSNVLKNSIIHNYDDDIIIDFTRWIIDLCHENKMIKSEEYYLLTNKICQFNLCNKRSNYNNIFMLSCDPNIINSIFANENENNTIEPTKIKNQKEFDILKKGGQVKN